jgi:hypothetical protein
MLVAAGHCRNTGSSVTSFAGTSCRSASGLARACAMTCACWRSGKPMNSAENKGWALDKSVLE